MKLPTHRLLLLLAASASPAFAQFAPPPPARPFPGFLNEALRASDPYMNAWDFSVNIRGRYENKDNAGTTDAGSPWDFSTRKNDDNDNHYYLLRVMPKVAYTSKWFAFTVEGRTSYSYRDERYNATAPGNALTERDGPIDLHQAFVLIGNHKQFPVSAKLGRQELVYGDQRLVGHFRWNNNARTFDAVKVRYQQAYFGVDLWTGGLVYNANNEFNKSNSQDVFSGAYFNFPKASQKEIVEAYLLARNTARGIATDNWSNIAAPFRFPGAQDLYTAGLRIKSKPAAYDAWDYGVELMHQFGNRTAVFAATTPAAALAAPRLKQDAYAAVVQGGYTWSSAFAQPRLAFLYSYASGDKNSADGKSQTFQNLFPTNHLFYGYMDLSSLQNIHDYRLALTLKPKPTVSLALEAHDQYLDKTTDFWYNVAGVPRNFAGAAVGSGKGYRINLNYGNHLGQEIDFVAGWSFTPSAQLEFGASHYFRDDYIKQSLAVSGSRDASYTYVQLTIGL